MVTKEFFEDYPLYRKCSLNSLPGHEFQIRYPSISLRCNECKSIQTFNASPKDRLAREMSIMAGQTADAGIPVMGTSLDGVVCHVSYRCTNQGCDGSWECFYRISEDRMSVQKVGQWPPWSVGTDRRVDEALGDHTEIFKKGLICESQGYGIGAFAYYRRIVELVIDKLLRDIGSVLSEDEGRKQYIEALERVSSSHIAHEKIDVVKNMLPPELRPSGINPLSELHSALSEGLHVDSDSDCLEIASIIRASLVFLVKKVAEISESTADFENSIRRLARRKSRGE